MFISLKTPSSRSRILHRSSPTPYSERPVSWSDKKGPEICSLWNCRIAGLRCRPYRCVVPPAEQWVMVYSGYILRQIMSSSTRKITTVKSSFSESNLGISKMPCMSLLDHIWSANRQRTGCGGALKPTPMNSWTSRLIFSLLRLSYVPHHVLDFREIFTDHIVHFHATETSQHCCWGRIIGRRRDPLAIVNEHQIS